MLRLPSSPSQSLKLILDKVSALGVKSSNTMRSTQNIVAFSGGIDSSLVASLVFSSFPRNTKCVIGRSRSLPEAQLNLAR